MEVATDGQIKLYDRIQALAEVLFSYAPFQYSDAGLWDGLDRVQK
jgi:hypothetical protein